MEMKNNGESASKHSLLTPPRHARDPNKEPWRGLFPLITSLGNEFVT